MSDVKQYRVGFVGLGLIGGSLALALRHADFAAHIVAWDRDPLVLEEGQRAGVIDAAAGSVLKLMASGVDIAVLATPTLACEPLILEMLRHAGSTRCITDVASVKGPLCRAVETLPPEQRQLYVPGHPIAGSERSGVGSARYDLFRGHRVILTPDVTTDPEALSLAEQLWVASGAVVQCMGVAEHDAVLAATSHLPHVLAYALVDALAQSPTRDNVFRYAAGGFRDFTRIASSDPVMWRDIALANRDQLLAAMDGFSKHLGDLRAAIVASDSAALEKTFRAAKTARDDFARDLAQRNRSAD